MKRRIRPLYIDAGAIIEVGKLIPAIGLIAGVIFGAYKWYLKQDALKGEMEKNKKEQEKENENLKEAIQELRHDHVEDIRKIQKEACLHTYGILACLKGLQEKGCNGPVTEAIDKIEKHINKQAHDQEE